jgi:aminodeoxyfutalosine deaminase
VEDVARLYRFRDFAHFIEIWMMTTAVLLRADDFRQVVVDYAEQAARYGAVYLEGIFSPAEPAREGSSGRRSSRATATVRRRRVNGTASRCV